MLKVLEHPLITHKLTQLRRKETGTKDFRHLLDEISGLMAYEISGDLPLKEIVVETPVGTCSTHEIVKEIVLIPILRAGLGMVDGIRNLISTAKVGHIGIYRNEKTLAPIAYYSKVPKNLPEAIVMVLDPMLATGGSASSAISGLKEEGAKVIRLVCVVGAPEGVKKIESEHPDVDIYLAALDEKLNDMGYIVPGLGDAGDRLFGTK
jgi:uracil phosphoribosyltransferase